MEEGLDHLINLIEKSLNLDSQEKIKKIEEEIQVAFQKFKEELSGQTKESLNIDKDKVDRLSTLLKELNHKHHAQKEFLDDFSNFLKNRKIN